MNWVDYGIIAITVLSVLFGLMRGFVREVFGLGTWVLAIGLAVFLGKELALELQGSITTPILRAGVAYGGLFLGGLLVGGILTALLVARIRESRFSSADRTLGAGVGLVRGVLVVGLAVLLAATAGMSSKTWWTESQLIQPSTVIADGLEVVIPDSFLDLLRPDPPQAEATKVGTAEEGSLQKKMSDAANQAMRDVVEEEVTRKLSGLEGSTAPAEAVSGGDPAVQEGDK